MSLQVISRYLLGAPLSWIEEVSRHLYIYMVFFGASAAIRDRSHVAVAFAIASLFAPLRLLLALTMNALILGFLAVMIWAGWSLVRRNLDVPTVTLEIPFALINAAVPAAVVLMVVRTCVQMHEDIEAHRRNELNVDRQRSLL